MRHKFGIDPAQIRRGKRFSVSLIFLPPELQGDRMSEKIIAYALLYDKVRLSFLAGETWSFVIS